MKNYIQGKEFKYYDILKASQENLTKEFFTAYPNYYDPDETYVSSPNHQGPHLHSWKIYPVKYIPKFYTSIEDIKNAEQFQAYYKEKFPTAYNLVQYFQDSVSTAAYLILEPHSYIDWHHDVENPDGTRISVHIPLDIPNGDLALDVDGELNRWEDIFAFYNEKIHRAWNNTDRPRLIFLLDFTKKSCGVT